MPGTVLVTVGNKVNRILVTEFMIWRSSGVMILQIVLKIFKIFYYKYESVNKGKYV